MLSLPEQCYHCNALRDNATRWLLLASCAYYDRNISIIVHFRKKFSSLPLKTEKATILFINQNKIRKMCHDEKCLWNIKSLNFNHLLHDKNFILCFIRVHIYTLTIIYIYIFSSYTLLVGIFQSAVTFLRAASLHEVRNRAPSVKPRGRSPAFFPVFGEAERAGRLNASATNGRFRNRLSAQHNNCRSPSSRPRCNLAHHMASRSTRGTAINTIAPVRACAAHVHTAHSLASETYVDRGRV